MCLYYVRFYDQSDNFDLNYGEQSEYLWEDVWNFVSDWNFCLSCRIRKGFKSQTKITWVRNKCYLKVENLSSEKCLFGVRAK